MRANGYKLRNGKPPSWISDDDDAYRSGFIEGQVSQMTAMEQETNAKYLDRIRNETHEIRHCLATAFEWWMSWTGVTGPESPDEQRDAERCRQALADTAGHSKP